MVCFSVPLVASQQLDKSVILGTGTSINWPSMTVNAQTPYIPPYYCNGMAWQNAADYIGQQTTSTGLCSSDVLLNQPRNSLPNDQSSDRDQTTAQSSKIESANTSIPEYGEIIFV